MTLSFPRYQRLACTALAFAAALALAGCARRAAAPAGQGGQPAAAHSEVNRGPVRLSVAVEPSPMRLSDEPQLTIRIESDQGVVVRKPEFGAALGDFVIRDFREPMPQVQGERQIVQQIYTLEPTRTGKITLDPVTVHFTDNRPGGTHQEYSVQSEPITVEVAAVVAADAPSLDQLRGPAEPLPLPPSPAGVSWWIAGLVAAAVAGLAVLWWRRRRKAQLAAPSLTPTELAYLELARLLENQAAQDDVKLFYVELTAVVRRYIERTAGIHAPEQTTQEFLHEISRRPDFPRDEAQRLQSFLESADLVKFAAHRPRKEDVEESFRRAQVFVGCPPAQGAAA